MALILKCYKKQEISLVAIGKKLVYKILFSYTTFLLFKYFNKPKMIKIYKINHPQKTILEIIVAIAIILINLKKKPKPK